MTNREKLFKVLEEMDNSTLSDVIDFKHCNDCPAKNYCIKHPRAGTCQETKCKWLDERGKGSKDDN